MRKKYDLYSLYLIPALTLLLAAGFSLTDTNFSVIGNGGGRRLLFFVWGLLAGNYMYLYTEELLRTYGREDPLMKALLFGGLACLISGIGLPYVPRLAPRLSRTHVLISFGSALLLAAAQLRFLLLLQRKYGRLFAEQWFAQLFICLTAACLFFSIGIVSSLLEIFTTLSICLYLHRLHRKLEQLSFIKELQ